MPKINLVGCAVDFIFRMLTLQQQRHAITKQNVIVNVK